MNYFRQIYYEMTHQKMMTWVSISGTALAIFLVMVFLMGDSIHYVETSPESKRGRILVGKGCDLQTEESSMSSTGYNPRFAKQLYEGLDGVERVSMKKASFDGLCHVSAGSGEKLNRVCLGVDDEFWNIYDFNFIDGRPFETGEVDSNQKLVILTKSLAHELFGEEKVSGREVTIDTYPYRVVGVVEDVNPLLSNTFANLYRLINPIEESKGAFDNWGEYIGDYMGDFYVVLLMEKGVKPEYIKKQVEERYIKAQSELSNKGLTIIYHKSPFTIEEELSGFGGNSDPDVTSNRRKNWAVYFVLLLLPAINLSSMMKGRLRHRISEIGVRRAYGASKKSIIFQILGENMIITVFGGVIGLLFSFLFMKFLFHLFFNFSGIFGPTNLEIGNARPEISMLFTWGNFFWTLVICFVLNLASAFVPAWRASKGYPVKALSNTPN